MQCSHSHSTVRFLPCIGYPHSALPCSTGLWTCLAEWTGIQTLPVFCELLVNIFYNIFFSNVQNAVFLIWWNFLIYSFLKDTHLALKTFLLKLNSFSETPQLLPSPADGAWDLAEPCTCILYRQWHDIKKKNWDMKHCWAVLCIDNINQNQCLKLIFCGTSDSGEVDLNFPFPKCTSMSLYHYISSLPAPCALCSARESTLNEPSNLKTVEGNQDTNDVWHG